MIWKIIGSLVKKLRLHRNIKFMDFIHKLDSRPREKPWTKQAWEKYRNEQKAD